MKKGPNVRRALYETHNGIGKKKTRIYKYRLYLNLK